MGFSEVEIFNINCVSSLVSQWILMESSQTNRNVVRFERF